MVDVVQGAVSVSFFAGSAGAQIDGVLWGGGLHKTDLELRTDSVDSAIHTGIAGVVVVVVVQGVLEAIGSDCFHPGLLRRMLEIFNIDTIIGPSGGVRVGAYAATNTRHSKTAKRRRRN